MKLSFIEVLKYFLTIVVITFLTFFFHELFHWIGYEILGYDAGFTLNGASVKDSNIELPKSHRMLTNALGPLFTMAQAFVFFMILKKHKNIYLYPFLFIPFLMRLGATWANQFQPNDEGRISLDLGLNLYTISAVVVGILFFLVFKISRNNKIPMLVNLITLVLSIIAIMGHVYLDFKFKVRFV